ncbi:MAG: YcxB family protein [Massilia sp.]
MTAIWIVGCFLVFTVGLRRPTDTPLEAILASLIMSSVLILFVWRLGTFARNRQWRQLEAMQQTVTGKLGTDGLEWNTPMTSANFPWPKIVKIRRHPEMLLLFYSARCAFYLPRTFFATEAAWNEANALAIRQMPA